MSGRVPSIESAVSGAVFLQVVERIVLEVELLLPLVRVALSCLAVDDLQLLQAQAVGEGQVNVVLTLYVMLYNHMHCLYC
jgi:hypothetical protein